MYLSEIPGGTISGPPAPSAPPLPPEIVSMVPLSSNGDDHALLDPIISTPSANVPIKTRENGKNGLEVHSGLPPHSLVAWSTGLCCCCHDPSTCCLTCCCPCITFGRIAEIADRGSTSCGISGGLYMLILLVTGCPCLYSCFYRSKLRGQYFLEEKPCCDCCVHCCFEPCALCQEYRQLKNLGFNMSIGWHGNMERREREANAVPPSVKIDRQR